MKFEEFYPRFAGSCRTKHLNLGLWAAITKVVGRSLGLGGYQPKPSRNKRPWRLPKPKDLPAEFIRVDPWEMEYLFLLASSATQGIVEIGRNKGGSLFILACANEMVPIYSVDLKPRNDQRLLRLFKEQEVGANVELLVGDSQTTKYPQIGAIDLLFVDGDHSYEGCLKDLENWWPHVAPGGHIVAHDCYFPNPPQRAVIDFIDAHEVNVVRTPYIPPTHWHGASGSLAHFIKK